MGQVDLEETVYFDNLKTATATKEDEGKGTGYQRASIT